MLYEERDECQPIEVSISVVCYASAVYNLRLRVKQGTSCSDLFTTSFDLEFHVASRSKGGLRGSPETLCENMICVESFLRPIALTGLNRWNDSFALLYRPPSQSDFIDRAKV